MLHRVINKDLTFLKAVIKISESQRGMKGGGRGEMSCDTYKTI